MDEKIKKLYDNLLSGGLTVEQIGTPDTFAKNITDSASNKAFYEKMLSSGKFTVEQIGTYDTFAENTLGSVKKKDTPQTSSPLPEGWQERQQEVLGGGGQPSTEPSKLASESPAEPLSPQSDTIPPLEDKTSIFEPYDPMRPPSDGEVVDATAIAPPPVEGLDINSIKESVRSDLRIEDETPVMTPAAYAEDRKITPAELNDPSFKNMFTREGKLTTLDVEAADIILEKIRLGESALAGQLTEVPVIKQWINEYPAAAPLFNFLQGVNRGLANTILPAIDGAQKMFYAGLGAAMETTLIPSAQEAGTKLKEQQKGQTWAGRAFEYMNKSLDENWPVADRGDALSGLVYDFGEFLPFLSTLSVTPNASLSGVSMKLPINLATISATGEYSQSQDFAKTIEAAGVGAADGAAIMMLGMGAGKAGQWTSQHLSKTIKPGMAGLVGASSNAAILTTGGAMHSVGNQLMHNGEVDWDQVRSDGMFWLMFGGEGIVRSAASAYHLAPRSVIQEARRYEVDIETLRERAIELAEKASKEPDPRKKTEMSIGASQLYKFADLKGMERIVGENKDAAIKSVLDSKLSATEKQELIQKIEESAAYLEQRRQTRELETAGDILKAEAAEKASEKPVEPLSPESEGKVPPEGKKPSTDTKQPSKEGVMTDRKVEDNIELVETGDLPSVKSITSKIKDYVDNKLERDFVEGGGKEIRLGSEDFTFSNAENALGNNKARVKSIEDIRALQAELAESMKKIDAEIESRTKEAEPKEGQVKYGNKIFESPEALKQELMNVENVDRLPLSNDPQVMRVLNEVKQDKGMISKETESRAVKSKLDKPTYSEQEVAEIPSLKEQAKALKQEAEPLELMDPRKKELLNEAKEINRKVEKIEEFVERQKTETDATEKQSTTEVPVGDQAKARTEVREGDTKAPEKETPKKSERSIAEEAVQSFSISMKPETVNKQAEKLKQKMQDAKLDKKAKDDLLKGFLDANKAKIKEAGLSAADLKKLRTASTWTQVGRTIQKLTTEMAKPTPKMRAAAMDDFIRGNKGAFKGLNSRAYEAMLKKVAEASTSDAKLDLARKYIEDVLGKQEVRELANEKANIIAQIEKEVGAKAIFEKGARGGQRKRVKSSRRTESSELSQLAEELGQFVKDGKSKRTPNPAAEMDRLLTELDAINKKEKTEADLRRAEDIHERLIQLRFSDIQNVGVETAAALRDYAKSLTVEGRMQSAREKEARIKVYTDLSQLHINEISPAIKKGTVEGSPAFASRTRSIDVWGDMSFNSFLSTLARKGEHVPGRQVFNDKLNEAVARTYVLKAERSKDGLANRHRKEKEDALKKIFGTQLKGELALMEGNNPKEKTGVFVYDQNGNPIREIAISHVQAVEKILQSRDANGYESMMKPIEQGGMGYTPKTLEQLKAYVPEKIMRFGEWAYENQKAWGRDVYNPVYEKLNGIPFADFSEGYWRMTRDSSKPGAVTEVGDYAQSFGVPSRRTISRTGVTSPLKYTSFVATYENYIQEAIRYASWAEPHKILSYVYKNKQVRDAIGEAHGTRALKVLDHFLDVFGGQYTARASIPAVDFLINNSSKSILAFKTMTGFKQLISSVYVGIDMPMWKVLQAPIKNYTPNTVGFEVRKWLAKQSEFVGARGGGSYWNLDMGLNESLPLYGRQTSEWSKTYSALQKGRVIGSAAQRGFDQAQGAIIKYADRYPITVVGAEYLQHQYAKYAKKPLTKKVLSNHMQGKIDKNLEKAYNDWEWSASLLQQSTRESNISMMRRQDSFGRAFGQFTSGPAQLWRAEADAVRKFKKANAAGDTKGQWDALRTLAITHVLGGALFGLADNRFQWDTEHMMWSMAKGNIAGVLYIGRGVSSLIDRIEDKPWAEATLGQIPFTQYLFASVDAATTIAEESTAPSPDFYEIGQAYKKMLFNTSMLFGVGVEGLLSLTQDATKPLKGEVGGLKDVFGWTDRWDPTSIDNRKRDLRKEADRAIGWKKGEMTYDEDAIKKVMKKASDQGVNPIEIISGVLQSEGYRFEKRKYGGIKTKAEFTKRMLELKENNDEFGMAVLAGMYGDFFDEVMAQETGMLSWDKNNIDGIINDMLQILQDNKSFYRDIEDSDQSQEND
jgi:hypothetical protein